MKDAIRQVIIRFIEEYCAKDGGENLWQEPLVGFGDANGEYIRKLMEVVVPSHFMPEDFLHGANTVISYYLPFKKEIGDGNAKGEMASDQWAKAYLRTNEMAISLNERLVEAVQGMGGRAAAPQNIGIISDEVLMSRWSQRHVAYACGLGTFGLNNMLISDKGCCGRYFSIVADLNTEHDSPAGDERCLQKRFGTCGKCARRCVASALNDTFDRARCYQQCMENEKANKGADVCGKCVVNMPCSFADPTAKK